MLHQTPYKPETENRRPLPNENSKLLAVRACHAQAEQPAQGRMRDHVRGIVEEAQIKPRLTDDRNGIDSEGTQGRRDLLGDTQFGVTGTERDHATYGKRRQIR